MVLAFSPAPNTQTIENWTIISQDLPAFAREECVWNHTIGALGRLLGTTLGGWPAARKPETFGWEDVLDHASSPGGISRLPPDSYC